MTNIRDDLDSAARTLLQTIVGDDTLTEEKSRLSAEKVKAFQAVVEYYKTRSALNPEAPTQEGKFAGIKRNFNGDSPSPRRRRSPRAPAAGADADANVVEFPGPADPEPPDSGDAGSA